MQNKERRQRNLILRMLFRQPQPKGPTHEEKKEVLERALAKFFADHDKVSNEVNLFPLTRAKNEVERMEKEGSLDYHFEWFLLQQDYLKKSCSVTGTLHQTKLTASKISK